MKCFMLEIALFSFLVAMKSGAKAKIWKYFPGFEC